MGMPAAVFTLSLRLSNESWTFLIAAVVEVAKETLRLSRSLTEELESESNFRRLS